MQWRSGPDPCLYVADQRLELFHVIESLSPGGWTWLHPAQPLQIMLVARLSASCRYKIRLRSGGCWNSVLGFYLVCSIQSSSFIALITWLDIAPNM